jgi:predicted metal-dependent peptidase
VVLDTSASMDRESLAAALGSIAGYALSRGVRATRLVFCDAAPHDRGYVRPEELLDWVDIRGRGGTVLQGALDMLEDAQDFPVSSPILIVTDGLCDQLSTRREHAFLVPPRHQMQFETLAPVFEMS